MVSMGSLKNYERRELMIEIISRKERRLVSVSGEVKFIRNLTQDKPLYSLSTELEFLKIEMNYMQLKDIVQLISQVSAFGNADKHFKDNEVSDHEQLALQGEFRNEFQGAYDAEFGKISEEMSDIILKVCKKYLMAWTKDCMRAIIKRQRV